MSDSSHAPTRKLPTTHWSEIVAAGRAQTPEGEAALERLLCRYQPALKMYLERQFHVTPEQAEDWWQGFVLEKLLAKNLLGRADRERGKFRALVLTALSHYVCAQLRKRSVSTVPFAFDEAGEHEPQLPMVHPVPAFDVPWAQQILDDALRQMQAECAQTGRVDIWEVFDSRLLTPMLDGAKPPAYQDLIARLGLESPMQAANLLLTAKRMFTRCLRSVVAEYVPTEGIDAEIEELKAVLAHSG